MKYLLFSEVYFKAPSKVKPSTIRDVKASHIGQLVKISGIVTRCSDVKPLMAVAVYTCEDCGHEIYQVPNYACQIVVFYFILLTTNSDYLSFTCQIRRLHLESSCLCLSVPPAAVALTAKLEILFYSSEHQSF